MTRRALIMLVLALVLAGLVAWQYWPATGVDPVAGGGGGAASAPAAAAGLNPLSGRGMTALADWTAHPLFAPDRRPPAAAPAPAPAEVAVVATPEVSAPEAPATPVLQGVVVTPAPGGAYLGLGPTGPSQFLRPGQQALGLTLEAVFDDRATFMGPDGEVTLPLMPAPPRQAPADGSAAPDPNGPAPTEGDSSGAGMADPSSSGLPAPDGTGAGP